MARSSTIQSGTSPAPSTGPLYMLLQALTNEQLGLEPSASRVMFRQGCIREPRSHRLCRMLSGRDAYYTECKVCRYVRQASRDFLDGTWPRIDSRFWSERMVRRR